MPNEGLFLPVACVGVILLSSLGLVVNFGGLAPPSVTVSITVDAAAPTTPLPSWGLNVAATHDFNSSDAKLVADTPARFLRFPSGTFTESLNWTSGVLTQPDGVTDHATTTLAAFVGACQQIQCEAILGLPAEIDEPSTAAYYVAYTERTLGFHPAYWEIGNEPSTWSHFGQPWSQWGTPGTGVTPSQYAVLVEQYIAAIRQVDPSTPILGLAAAEQGNPTAWIPPLLALDGKELAGISIHAYPAVPTPVLVSPIRYFSSLSYGEYAIPTVVPGYLATIASSCPECSVDLFLTETGTTDGGTGAYAGYDASFDGALYEAAEVTQLLAQKVENVDWFTFQGGYAGAWVTPAAQPTPTFLLFRDIITQLGSDSLPTTVAGYPGVYAVATTGAPHGYALLVVNTNVASRVMFDLARAGFAQPTVSATYWPNGASGPVETNFSGSAVLAPVSVALLYQSQPPTSSPPGGGSEFSLVGLVNPAILVSLGGVGAGIGAATLLAVPSYYRILGVGAGLLGVLLLLLVI
ncbi:MAG: hypothetical protein WA688_02060 [Thermoplasmata archaeon]